jgi:hypothetical protein
MPNIRLIREGLEAGDDLGAMLKCEVSLDDEWVRKLIIEKLRKVHAGLREVVELERTTIKNRRVDDEYT